MNRIPSMADPNCDADYCPHCERYLVALKLSDDEVQKVCMNLECQLCEEFEETDTPTLKMNGEEQFISALSAIAFTRETDPVALKKMARDALSNVPVGVAGNVRFRSAIIQVVSGIDALLDDQQVITLRMQDGEFLAHIKRDGTSMFSTDKKSWLLCILGVALAWASDGELSSRGGK